MQEFIARENIARFELRLREAMDEPTRRLLRKLLRDEERRLDEAVRDKSAVTRTSAVTRRQDPPA